MPELDKPPLGLLPYFLWLDLVLPDDFTVQDLLDRFTNVVDAIGRRRGTDWPIPEAWLCEAGICPECNPRFHQGEWR